MTFAGAAGDALDPGFAAVTAKLAVGFAWSSEDDPQAKAPMAAEALMNRANALDGRSR
jgi:hypothetical protein